MIELPLLSATAALWRRLISLTAIQPEGWTLVGAQMVALHAYEQGMVPPRATTDADVLVNVRVVRDATEKFSRMLVDHKLQLDGVSPDGIGHRFSDGQVKIDVLAPDGIDRRRTRLTTLPPARTVCVPGGTQALRRSQRVDVCLGDLVGQIPRPDLLGAILIKARAVDVDDVREAQLADLAFLLSLVAEPRGLRAQLRGNERSWLRRRKELQERAARPWRTLTAEEADNAHLAFRLLSDL